MSETGIQPFDYKRPKDWAEAIALLSEPGAVAKMGGLDVMTRYRRGKLTARTVVGLNDLPGVRELRFGPDGARIGAAVTIAQLTRSAEFARRWPVLAKVMGEIASPAIRNAATVVGNVAQGWSTGDLVPLFQVCGAVLEIRGPQGERALPVTDYAQTPGAAALQPGEIITALELPAPPPDHRLVYERFALRNAFELPVVAVAVSAVLRGATYHDFRVAAVGGRPMPARCQPVETLLEGCRDLRGQVEAAATAIADWSQPPSDWRASAAYRRHVLTVMLNKALARLVQSKAVE
ncbi:FAD binding domain-containing protein [Rhodoligotrophos defluvii]|uniref:FAD binding domain-containing protein n=1 Tax=Rhodoligotrophos defluvii TaxID=2561934 RepID=UPI0010C980FF|nr:FAD binding domain-containing protein [Rhodoligotrophos defluvii]